MIKLKKNKSPELNLRRKIVMCVVVLVLASLVGTVILLYMSLSSNLNKKSVYAEDMQARIVQYNSVQEQRIKEFDKLDNQRLVREASLTASVLKRKYEAGDESIREPRMYDEGAIIRFDGKKAEFPKGIPDDLNTDEIVPAGTAGCKVIVSKELSDYAESAVDDAEQSGESTEGADGNSGENGAGDDAEQSSESGESSAEGFDEEDPLKSTYYAAYALIKDNLYYVQWMPYDDFLSGSVSNAIDWGSMIDEFAELYNADFVFAGEPEEGQPAMVLNGTNEFSKYENVEQMGMSWELIKASMERSIMLPVFANKTLYIMQAKDYDDLAELQGNKGSVQEDTGLAFLMLIPVRTLLMNYKGLLMTFLLLMLLLCVVLIVWTISTYNVVMTGGVKGMSEEKRKEFRPFSVKQKVLTYATVAVLLMGGACAYSHTLNDLFRESVQTYDRLESITSSIKKAEKTNDKKMKSLETQYVKCAEKIAAILDENPDLRNADWLGEASGIIDADYIMLYDTSGDEVLTNSRYKDMSLGKDEDSATYDFRRLLKGVKSISHESLKDEVTGKVRDMYGISLKYVGKDKDAYGAMIIFVDPETRASVDVLDINSIMKDHTLSHSVSLAADPEDGKIKYSSASSLRESNVRDQGFKEEDLKGALIGFFNIGQNEMFGRSLEYDDLIYYYAVDMKDMFSGTGRYALVCMIMFLAVISLIVIVLTHGYTNASFKYYMNKDAGAGAADASAAASTAGAAASIGAPAAAQGRVTGGIAEAVSSGIEDAAAKAIEAKKTNVRAAEEAVIDNVADMAGVSTEELEEAAEKPRSLPKRIRSALGLEGTPLQIAMTTMMLLGVAYLVLIAFMTMTSSGSSQEANASAIRYIMYGDWGRGVNIFSITAVFFIVCILALIEVALYLAKVTMKRVLDSRGVTIGSLVISVLQTLALVAAVCIALGYLGVDYKAILASVGIFSMAFTFGAKDFVSDMFAGIDLVTNNTYHVGDIVQIDGYTGTVQEVTMRITKLVGDGGNIKTFRNSNIGSVVNLSVRNSWYPLELNIASDTDIGEMEKMLREKLPAVGESSPMIISGPEYRGVESVSSGKFLILFLTECRQKDYYKVEKIVNQAVYKLLEEHGVKIV